MVNKRGAEEGNMLDGSVFQARKLLFLG